MTPFQKLSLTEMEGRTSKQKMEQCWMEEKWWRKGTARFSRKREDVHATLQCAANFVCLEWHDCEEHKPKRKIQLTVVDKNLEAEKRRTVWCVTENRQSHVPTASALSDHFVG